MSEAAVLAALRVMGFDKNTVTGHGFRATARTLLDEVLGFRPDTIEHQLAPGNGFESRGLGAQTVRSSSPT